MKRLASHCIVGAASNWHVQSRYTAKELLAAGPLGVPHGCRRWILKEILASLSSVRVEHREKLSSSLYVRSRGVGY
jgi:hypothetical protein